MVDTVSILFFPCALRQWRRGAGRSNYNITSARPSVLCKRISFSARMPKSSFARVRRVLVLHMEDADVQENEKGDEREGGKQRVEGRVVENQNNHMMST